MSQSGIKNIDLTKLSSAANSNQQSRDPSLDSNKQGRTTNKQNQNHTQGRNNNRKGRRRILTPYKKNRSNNFKKSKNQQTPSSSISKSQRIYSRGTNRRYSTLSNKSYQKQTSKKRAWKSQVFKYWKKGQCKYGDECEWQHYDYTQIDFCEQRKKERYNQINAEGLYLVQLTTIQYMREEQIMALIGNPTQMKQSIAIAIKNKRQSKLMKKEIMKELRKGKLNDEEQINMKKRIIKKQRAHMQIDVANQIAMKRMEKKQQRILQLKEKKLKKENEKIDEEMEIATHKQQSQQNQPKIITRQILLYQQYVLRIQQVIINQNNKQMMQSNNNKSQQEIDQRNNTDLEESNLYFDSVPQQLQIQQIYQQQIQQQAPLYQNFIKNNKNIQPGVYKIIKGNQPQQSTLNFPPKSAEDQQQGTGITTQIMDDNELKKYYMVDETEKVNIQMIIQNITQSPWNKDIIDGVSQTNIQDRDKMEAQWDWHGVIIININAKALNELLAQQNQSKDPTESPLYKAKQIIISATLRCMELKSDYRRQVSSQRTQIFILNKIKDKLEVKKDTLWVTGMDKRETEVIKKDNQDPLCIIIKFN